MQRNIFDKTNIIFWAIGLILSFNIIGSIFDIKLIFIATAFSLLSYFLDNKNRFGIAFALFLMIIIEINQSFYPLSTIFVSLIVYLYISPFFKQHLGCNSCHIFVNSLVFYTIYFGLMMIFDKTELDTIGYISLIVFNIMSEFIFFTFGYL
jgi:hypothetical protein